MTERHYKMKNKLNVKGHSIWTILAWLFVVTCLVFAGCSKQFADVKDSQIKLQNVVQAHSQQITANAADVQAVVGTLNGIAQNQTTMQQQITALQNDQQLLREQMMSILKQFKEQLSQISAQINSSGTAKK
jgi:septal ring factor EnvC (AmiA/AmiB activator)